VPRLDSRTKIVGVGWSRTGTTSLGVALQVLGYSVAEGFGESYMLSRLHNEAHRRLVEVDAVQDTPWCLLYDRIIEWFPRSKFILTTRALDDWYDSCSICFRNIETPMRRFLYGHKHASCEENEYIWKNRYERHNYEVREFFQTGDQFIEMYMPGFSWETLCSFLGDPIPVGSFPHVNKSPGGRAGLDFALVDYKSQLSG
jgi:hypothetical protein